MNEQALCTILLALLWYQQGQTQIARQNMIIMMAAVLLLDELDDDSDAESKNESDDDPVVDSDDESKDELNDDPDVDSDDELRVDLDDESYDDYSDDDSVTTHATVPISHTNKAADITMSSSDCENIPPSNQRTNSSTKKRTRVDNNDDEDYAPKVKKLKKSLPSSSSQVQPSTITPKQRQNKLESLAKKFVKAIQEQGHHRQKKPRAEVVEGMSYADALALLGNSGTIVSDNARWHRRTYTAREIVETFGMPKLVHPVKYSGMVLCVRGKPPPRLYAYAGYESLEVSMEKKSLLCKFKFRTFYRGTGEPSWLSEKDLSIYESYLDEPGCTSHADHIHDFE